MNVDGFRTKAEMMKLWSDTFHDSDEYIRLVFDAYFCEENIESLRNKDGKIVSSLLSVPYCFYAGIKGGNESKLRQKLKGLYLCGLATYPNYRGQGIMKKLMKNIESKAIENGFDFTFLIPASMSLRSYYGKMGYVSLPGKIECNVRFVGDIPQIKDDNFKMNLRGEKYSFDVSCNEGKFEIIDEDNRLFSIVELNICEREFENIIYENPPVLLSNFECIGQCEDSVEKRTQNPRGCSSSLLNDLYRMICEMEEKVAPFAIRHNWRDFVAAVRENNISDGRVVVLQNCDCKPFAVIFCYNSTEGDRIDIRFAASRSEDQIALLLLYLKLCCYPYVSDAIISYPVNEIFNEENTSFELTLLPERSKEVFRITIDRSSAKILPYGMIKWILGSSKEMNPNKYVRDFSILNSQGVDDLRNIAKCQKSSSIAEIGELNKKYSELFVNDIASGCENENKLFVNAENCKCNLYNNFGTTITPFSIINGCTGCDNLSLNISLMLD